MSGQQAGTLHEMTIWTRVKTAACGEACRSLPPAEHARLAAAFAAEEYAGLRVAIGLRMIALLAVGAILALETGWPLVLNYLTWLLALAMSGYAQLLICQPQVHRPWMRWLFPLIDMAMIGAAIALPNPFDPQPLPPPARLAFDAVLYLPLFLTLASLGQSVRTVLFSTLAAISTWMLVTFYVSAQPGVHTQPLAMPSDGVRSLEDRLAQLIDPWLVSYGSMARQILVIALIGLILAVTAQRARHLVARQIEAERERRNLARHFSPHMADELAHMDEAVGRVRQLDAAVLFADLVGFTRLTENMPPTETIALLRDVHKRLAQAVFNQQGTLDKYLGDGIMASFGTPRTGPRDASSALLAARAMLQAINQLNLQRAKHKLQPLRLAVGLHFGAVTLGNLGDETRIEYALVGETVNVAHRLEQLNRQLDSSICVSAAFVEKLKQETRGDLSAIRDMTALRPQIIRGLREMMAVWILPVRDWADASIGQDARSGPASEPPPTIH